MRLLMISSEFPPGPGGIGSHAHQLARHLDRLGWKVVVVSPQDYASRDDVTQFNSKQPFPVVSVRSGRGRLLEAVHRTRIAGRVARRHEPNLVIGTGFSGVSVAATVAAIRRVPALAVAHGSEFGASSGMSATLNRLGFGHVTAVVAVSQFTRGLVERAGIRPRRLEVIPNAGDAERFHVMPEHETRKFRETAGFGGAQLLLTVGQVSERKGQDVVIRALPRIAKRMPAVQYVMAGLPTLQEPLTRLAEELGVRDRVHFLGKVSSRELLSWMNCADVFVMTSRTTSTGDCEGFGIAVVEAALCGTPAVVANQSGLVEAIDDGVTGLAVPENDPSATADAIVSLLSDPAGRKAMGEAAQARAVREQTWDTCVRRYDVLLRDLL